MNTEETSFDVLYNHAQNLQSKAALLGVDDTAFTYGDLWMCLERFSAACAGRGVQRQDRLAMVFPEGPAAALAFLAISKNCTAAPLNPKYGERDFAFYLEDLQPKAVLVPENMDTPIVAVAEDHAIPIWPVQIPSAQAPHQFKLAEGSALASTVPSARQASQPEPGDIALILHTSGTTSRPKMVPLSHRNLTTSARNIGHTLHLAPGDRALNLMPLFHIHGIVAGLLSSLVAGGSVVCAPGFKGASFFTWAKQLQATWYSAVPTIHQAVLAQIHENPSLTSDIQFRFIRSSSSALPPSVFQEMEAIWKAPVIEAYGMTEAAHQMTSNPSVSGERKPGSVGPPAGPQVGIMDAVGNLLETGQTGEVVIQGANVTTGYLNNPQANAKAFHQGWFRTGDQGHIDADGYLFLTGRLKEMINRGGENIAPNEIDAILTEHERVAQAVAFAVPHPTLGEDLAAAVVPVREAAVSESELRDFLAEKLAGFKVPSRIIFLESIPKGATGKLQRIGLYEKIKEHFERAYEAPQGEDETCVAIIFSEVLNVERMSRTDNFFYLGGDSLKAQRVLARLQDHYHLDIQPGMIFRFPSPQALGAQIAHMRDEEANLDALAQELAGYSEDEIQRLLTESE